MAEAARAAWTPERRERASRLRGELGVNFGRKWTDEQKEQKRQWMLANAPNRGKTPSEEWRAKLSKAHRGKTAQLAKYGVSLEEYGSQIAAGNRWCCHGKHFVPESEINTSGICGKCAPEFWRKQALRRDYGVTQEWYETKLAEQGGHCAICERGASRGDKHLAVDHNHKTEAIRGLLCSRCNAAIERLETVPDWGLKALAYLARYS
jgi:hypothetical protein